MFYTHDQTADAGGKSQRLRTPWCTWGVWRCRSRALMLVRNRCSMCSVPSQHVLRARPLSLECKPPEHIDEQLRLSLCTTSAGDVGARNIDLAADPMVLHDMETPRAALIYTGGGGIPKSATASPRATA